MSDVSSIKNMDDYAAMAAQVSAPAPAPPAPAAGMPPMPDEFSNVALPDAGSLPDVSGNALDEPGPLNLNMLVAPGQQPLAAATPAPPQPIPKLGDYDDYDDYRKLPVLPDFNAPQPDPQQQQYQQPQAPQYPPQAPEQQPEQFPQYRSRPVDPLDNAIEAAVKELRAQGDMTPKWKVAQRLAGTQSPAEPAEPTAASVAETQAELDQIASEIEDARETGDFESYEDAMNRRSQATARLTEAQAAEQSAADAAEDARWESQVNFEKRIAAARHPQLNDPNSQLSQALRYEIEQLKDDPVLGDPATYGKLAELAHYKLSNPAFAAQAQAAPQYQPAPAYAMPPHQGASPVIPAQIPPQQHQQVAAPYPQQQPYPQYQAQQAQQPPMPYQPYSQGVPIAPQPPRGAAPAPDPFEAVGAALDKVGSLDELNKLTKHLFQGQR